jgi:hypothetical protein
LGLERHSGLRSRWRRATLLGLATPLCILAATLAPSIGRYTGDAISHGDDIIFHSKCADGFAQALREGVVYPRWLSDVNRGYGAPVFVFYPPLGPYVLGSAVVLLGDHYEAMRTTPVVLLFVSGIAFWLSVRRHLTPVGAAVGSVLYVILPYHILDMVWRFAWGEFLAFLWLPPLLLSLLELIERSSRRAWFVLVLSAAGLLLTHLPTAVLLPLALGPVALVQLLRTRHWRSLWSISGAVVVAVMCAGVFIIPLVVRMPEVHLEWTRGTGLDYQRHFVFRDETAFGYSADETKPVVTHAVWSQALLAAVALGLLVMSRNRSVSAGEPDPRNSVLDARVLGGLALWTVVLQTPLSSVLWKYWPLLDSVQFPWRFGTYQVLATALLCGKALSGFGRSALLTRFAALSLAVAPALVVSHMILPDDPSFDRDFIGSRDYEREEVREYIPQRVGGWRWLRRQVDRPKVLVAQGHVDVLSWQTHRRRLSIQSDVAQPVFLTTFAFPGWEARLDGEPVPLLEQDWRVAVDVPAGEHVLDVSFVPTWDRHLGAAVSAAGVGVLLIVAAVLHRSRRRSAS